MMTNSSIVTIVTFIYCQAIDQNAEQCLQMHENWEWYVLRQKIQQILIKIYFGKLEFIETSFFACILQAIQIGNISREIIVDSEILGKLCYYI